MTEPQQCFLEAYSERYSRGCPDCVYVNYSNCLRGRCENCPCPKCQPNKGAREAQLADLKELIVMAGEIRTLSKALIRLFIRSQWRERTMYGARLPAHEYVMANFRIKGLVRAAKKSERAIQLLENEVASE